MIDIENELYTVIATKLRSDFTGITIYSSESTTIEETFPVVTIIEQNNSIRQSTATTDDYENHADLMYQVDVYSNKVSGKKSECKKIMKVIDDIFHSFNFKRTMMQPIPNLADRTIYRLTATYTAVVSKEKIIYRS